jgi:hypothetical protein
MEFSGEILMTDGSGFSPIKLFMRKKVAPGQVESGSVMEVDREEYPG